MKIKWKNWSETKIKQKKVEKSGKSEKKSEKKRKKRKNRLEFRFALFASKQKLLNRSEAKNLKWKKASKQNYSSEVREKFEAKKEKWNFIVK